MRKAGKIGVGLFSTGVTAVGLLALRDHAPWLAKALSDQVLSAATAGVLLLMFTGTVLVVIDLVAAQFEAVLESENFEAHVAKSNQLDLVRTLATELFGPEVSSINRMKSWKKKHPRAVIAVCRRAESKAKRSQELVGYFCLVPLTESAEASLLSGDLKGSDIHDLHLAQDTARALYLGAIGAKGGIRAKAFTLGALNAELAKQGEARKAEIVYTRPVSDDGLRLAKRYGFTPVGGGELSKGQLARIEFHDLLPDATWLPAQP